MVAPGFARQGHGIRRMLGWRRVLLALGFSLAIGSLMSFGWKSGPVSVLTRTAGLGLTALLAFGLFEQWPKRLPAWLARWVLQVLGVALAMPLTTFLVYQLSTPAGAPPFWRVQDRLVGFVSLSIVGLLLAPWAALAALVRQKDALARHLSLTIEMERHAFERQALEARMRLLQAQVEPHFLFNTLANVRELVDTGSARASAVLNSLIAYLRAAVPKIHETSTAMRDELELVGAYLEVMQMRMPDRLEYGLHAEPQAQRVQCPPLTLLTLVENAVRHGIDPAEQPGRIDVRVAVKQGRCHAEVVDTGVGLGAGTGTGLANLMERMQLAFGAEVELQLHPVEPHGVHAELVFPAVLEAR
jgi:hypothetical protein